MVATLISTSHPAQRWRGKGEGGEGGRRECGEPEANATVAGSVEKFAAVPGPRMLQQRGGSASATTPASATTTSSATSSSSSSSSSSSANMFPQQYCLRWKYHHSNLQTMFSQLLERQAYCDVTLACEGKTLRAHKSLLITIESQI
ncbi:Protein bric-a-brac [Ooceraea biroi]|uniref:Protein bric-a-brac n=1 Tax=Ooceraea biroi TaxID=2015173 RepID=A0A026WC14_OOCBI|nr:Protein bric-a-brac [Ooceraea biroi]